jgi:ATP-dependent DNA ligase
VSNCTSTRGKRKVYTRNRLDWTKRFSQIAGAFDISRQAIFDGGVVVVHDRRRPADVRHAAKLNLEGIVSKRADAPYRSEGTEAWLKIKTVQKGKFPVIGFVKDPTGVAAPYLV